MNAFGRQTLYHHGYWPQSMKIVTFLIRKFYLIIFVDSEINNCEIIMKNNDNASNRETKDLAINLIPQY